ncbi:hypothetical protein [Melittangium boletus]|uniref:hypothetical protein n=1 Tax=Melittangium boletus TaxID=83453 RepID=UPI003DA21D91
MRSWPLLLALSACSPVRPLPVAPPVAPSPGCERARGTLPPLGEGGHILVLGEVHGNDVSPHLTGEVVCEALQGGRRVVLALELPGEESERIAAFLARGDRDALLEGPFWRRDYQDGRSSQAMVDLLDRARAWVTAGWPLSVVAMDTAGPGADRDAFMAGRVLAAHQERPQALVVVLVGNLHARARLSLPRSLAWRVKRAGAPLSTLWLSYPPGTTWLCDAGSRDRCGEHALGTGQASTPEGFDGVLDAGTPRASPPAFRGPSSAPASSPPSPEPTSPPPP